MGLRECVPGGTQRHRGDVVLCGSDSSAAVGQAATVPPTHAIPVALGCLPAVSHPPQTRACRSEHGGLRRPDRGSAGPAGGPAGRPVRSPPVSEHRRDEAGPRRVSLPNSRRPRLVTCLGVPAPSSPRRYTGTQRGPGPHLGLAEGPRAPALRAGYRETQQKGAPACACPRVRGASGIGARLPQVFQRAPHP